MKHKEGFTLFELLIAISIGTILIMSGAHAIRTGLSSMEREEAWFNNTTKEKAAFDFFWQQVTALRIQNILKKVDLFTEANEKTKKTAYFTGEKNSLTFVSPLSFKKHYGQGLVIANYSVKLNIDNGLWDLIYTETKVNPKILIKLSEEPESGISIFKDHTIFLNNCTTISFAYLETAKKNADEETDIEEAINEPVLDTDIIEGTNLKWKEKVIGKIPMAIKLIVSKNGREQEIISPIMVTSSFLAFGQ